MEKDVLYHISKNARVERVDHLPLVAAIIDKARIPQEIDAHCSVDPQLKVSPGTTVKAMILAILSGKYPLYQISKWIRLYAGDLLFEKGVDVKKFTDDRLAKTLDHLCKAGLDFLFSCIIMGVIEIFRIGINFLHQDNTSIKLYGAYEGEAEGPTVDNGFSHDYRPNLKQVTMSLTASNDGGIPVGDRIGNGNCSDQEANRFQLTDLKEHIPALQGNTFVADSKLFDAKTLGICIENDFHFITLVPETSSFRKKMIKKALKGGEIELLKEEKGRKKGEKITYHGVSFQDNYEVELPSGKRRLFL